ncbi:CstA-like transporter-associated (seleno)protein [Pantoea eucrina]|uniref:YbdD/YjiX family protein n=1 Tax=Pantoea eucrina TaxID=472693 RepID=A0ABU5LF91_9GAMM|nr:CstA-like transporter-associated (seleno)protein [Pantoea eucrina]MDZ7278320.1 YbdD/YjiX family protein [Pantoea eucrina]
MSDSLFRAPRPQGQWQIYTCTLQQTAPEGPARPRWRTLWQRLQQSFRLMVGVGDYQTYLRHMRERHPEHPPMDERAYHRYCLEARFPSQAGKLGKCPC